MSMTESSSSSKDVSSSCIIHADRKSHLHPVQYTILTSTPSFRSGTILGTFSSLGESAFSESLFSLHSAQSEDAETFSLTSLCPNPLLGAI